MLPDTTLPDVMLPDLPQPDKLAPADTASPDASKLSCKAMDAKGEGACEKHMGYAWDGKQCKGVSGCKCVGQDCSKLYANKAVCSKAYAHCP